MIQAPEKGYVVLLREDFCSALLPSEPFAINFFKGTLFVFFQTLLVLTVCLAGTTWLTAPTSIVLAILVFLICNIHGFLQEAVRDVQKQIEYSEKSAAQGKARTDPYGMPEWTLRSSSAINQAALAVLPDFGKMDPSAFFLEDISIGFNQLKDGFLEILYRLVPVLLIGCLLIYLRDFSL
jgi:hypothetical protein